MNKTVKRILKALMLISLATIFSCVSSRVDANGENPRALSRNLIGTGKKTPKQLYKFFMKNNRKADKKKVKYILVHLTSMMSCVIGRYWLYFKG